MVVDIPILQARDITYAYTRRPVLAGVDLTLRAGEMLGVIGPNGCGKSTLLGILSGLLAPSRGEVVLEGRPLLKEPRRKVARTLGLVPQEPQFSPGFSVLETVLSGRYSLMGRRLFEDGEDMAAAAKELGRLGLRELQNRLCGELSGGERQRLALARALAAEPRALLLDEPTSALDLDHQLRVMAILEELCRNGRAVLLVSHDLNLVSLFCDRLILMSGGGVLAQGPPEWVLTPEFLQKAYSVEAAVDREPSRDRPRITLIPHAPGGRGWKN